MFPVRKTVGSALVAVLKRLEGDPAAVKDGFVRTVLDESFRDFQNVFYKLYRAARESNTYGWKARVEDRMTGTVQRAVGAGGGWPRDGEIDPGPHGLWGQFRQDAEELAAILAHELEYNTQVLCTPGDYDRVDDRREICRQTRDGYNGAYKLYAHADRASGG